MSDANSVYPLHIASLDRQIELFKQLIEENRGLCEMPPNGDVDLMASLNNRFLDRMKGMEKALAETHSMKRFVDGHSLAYRTRHSSTRIANETKQ